MLPPLCSDYDFGIISAGLGINQFFKTAVSDDANVKRFRPQNGVKIPRFD